MAFHHNCRGLACRKFYKICRKSYSTSLAHWRPGGNAREIAKLMGCSHTTIENDLKDGKNLPKTGKNLPRPSLTGGREKSRSALVLANIFAHKRDNIFYFFI
jgi:hypothetical protein